MHYFKETPSLSTFRVITTNFLGVRIFRKFTVVCNDASENGCAPNLVPSINVLFAIVAYSVDQYQLGCFVNALPRQCHSFVDEFLVTDNKMH